MKVTMRSITQVSLRFNSPRPPGHPGRSKRFPMLGATSVAFVEHAVTSWKSIQRVDDIRLAWPLQSSSWIQLNLGEPFGRSPTNSWFRHNKIAINWGFQDMQHGNVVSTSRPRWNEGLKKAADDAHDTADAESDKGTWFASRTTSMMTLFDEPFVSSPALLPLLPETPFSRPIWTGFSYRIWKTGLNNTHFTFLMYLSTLTFVLRQRLRPQHDSRQPLESSTQNISRRYSVLQNGLPSPHHLPLVPHQQVHHSVPGCIGRQTCTDQRNLFSQSQPAG